LAFLGSVARSCSSALSAICPYCLNLSFINTARYSGLLHGNSLPFPATIQYKAEFRYPHYLLYYLQFYLSSRPFPILGMTLRRAASPQSLNMTVRYFDIWSGDDANFAQHAIPYADGMGFLISSALKFSFSKLGFRLLFLLSLIHSHRKRFILRIPKLIITSYYSFPQSLHKPSR